jgi:hypothetical protein
MTGVGAGLPAMRTGHALPLVEKSTIVDGSWKPASPSLPHASPLLSPRWTGPSALDAVLNRSAVDVEKRCVSHRYHAALNDALALQRIEPDLIDLLMSIRQIFVYFDCF